MNWGLAPTIVRIFIFSSKKKQQFCKQDPVSRRTGTSVIYLHRLSPDGFSDLPLPAPLAGTGRATRLRRVRNILGLSTHEVYPNRLSPAGPVVSYTAFSPLPRSPGAVVFCGTICFRGLYIRRTFPLGSMALFVVPTFLPGITAGTTEQTVAWQR